MLPTDLLDPGGELDYLTRAALNVAIATRARIEENVAYKRAMDEAREARENDDDDDSPRKPAPAKDRNKPRKHSADRGASNTLQLGKSGMSGSISGRIGSFDPTLAEQYEALGGTLPKQGERVASVDRMIEQRKARMQAFLDNKKKQPYHGRESKRLAMEAAKAARQAARQKEGQP